MFEAIGNFLMCFLEVDMYFVGLAMMRVEIILFIMDLRESLVDPIEIYMVFARMSRC